MNRLFLVILTIISSFTIYAQTIESEPDTTWKTNYRESYPKINDLVHTKLDVKFDYAKSWLYGKAWITLRPHFYSTDSLLLDAKGMELKEVFLIKGTLKSPLKFVYDSMQLNIKLDKIYKAGENYTIYIDYVSKPDELKVKGSAAINDAKGLYFINPKGEDKNKPTQIWTQGETESNSVWFPTIDKPNQKTTAEIYMTVLAKYVTLSNGALVSQKKNADGTRTDYWKMDLPHSPYLFFMGVGDYAIIKDSYKGKEVSYYVEKEYAPVARKIFGETPAMLPFFEKITGIPYVWPKYSQIVGRDYVSGAMENTTATLHQEGAYQDARQLTDENKWEGTIAHELFHQWFGDLVTAESWSNLTVNESFANYSEVLWFENRYGKDFADAHNFKDMQEYIASNSESKNLARFYYADKEDMFDAVSYNKGGRILHMLRNYVGTDAFYKALNKYLTDNKFKNAEATQLRLAFEDVTGKDLNWFWNQWYFGSGHPKLKIDYNYTTNTSQVIVEQTQNTGKIFTLPVAIDVYNGAAKKRYNVWIKNRIDTFTFATPVKPTLINVDADKILLTEKTDNKSAENYVQQWKYAQNYVDRKEALEYFAEKKMTDLTEGLSDKFAGLREFTLTALTGNKTLLTPEVLNKIEAIGNSDSSRKAKAKAIAILAEQSDKKYTSLFAKSVNDSSYFVSGNALQGLYRVDPEVALAEAKRLSSMPAKGDLAEAIGVVLVVNGDETGTNLLINFFKNLSFGQEKVDALEAFIFALSKTKSLDNLKSGIDALMEFKNKLPANYKETFAPVVPAILQGLQNAKQAEGQKDQADYISQLIKTL